MLQNIVYVLRIIFSNVGEFMVELTAAIKHARSAQGNITSLHTPVYFFTIMYLYM